MVDDKKLTKLVADKSRMNREQIEAQMDELRENIQSAAEAGGTFEMDGFGTFKQESNSIAFEPNKIFQTEINQKYAGMRPIELMGSFKETGAGIPAETAVGPAVIEKQALREPEVEMQQAESPALEEEIAAEETTGEKQKTPPSPRKPEKPEKANSDDETGVGSIILIIAVVIVAILLAGWLLYSIGVFSGGGSVSTVNATTNNVVLSDEFQFKNGQNNSEVNTASAAFASNEGKAASEKITVYGLKGTIQPDAENGYTIVVHSLRRKQHAFETLETIKQQGYRGIMLKSNVNGTMQWRLGIGQFKTIADAQKAAKTLPEPYKSNHFIKKQ